MNVVENIGDLTKYKDCINQNKYIFAFTWAPWCFLSFEIEEMCQNLTQEYPLIKFVKIEIEKSEELCEFE